MKKKVLLILTVIISMVLCIDRAEANTFPELTCIYDKTDSQPGIKFIQTREDFNKCFNQDNNRLWGYFIRCTKKAISMFY